VRELRRTALLSSVCFGRLLEKDVFPSSVTASHGIIWLMAALATPGVMVSASQYYFYAHARTFASHAQDRILFVSQAFHIDFAMAVAGLITMIVWTSLTPDRRDALVLGPLPLRTWEQACGRLMALARFFAIFAGAVSVPAAVAFTFVTVGPANVGEIAARIAGHMAATMLAAGFVFFALVDMQLLLAATLGPRAMAVATSLLEGAALLGMVGALSFTTRLADVLLSPETAGSAWVMWNPPAWFVGVYRWISGDDRDVYVVLALRGAIASGLALAVAILAYPIVYQRSMRTAIEGREHRATGWSRALTHLWLYSLAPLLRTPVDRGLAAFIIATLTRSHAHRFLIGSYACVAVVCALPLLPRLMDPPTAIEVRYAWFSVPLGLLCWMAAALRVGMMLPIEPAANWIFKLTEPVSWRRVLSTAAMVIVGAIAIPLALTFGIASGLAGGLGLGVTVFAVVLATGAAFAELLTLTLRSVPCTCTYRPGQLRLRALWPVYLLVWVAIAYRLPIPALWALGDVNRTIWLLGGLVAVWAALHMWRLARIGRLEQLAYDETEPRSVTILDLNRAGV
jgi:hypothetical protein